MNLKLTPPIVITDLAKQEIQSIIERKKVPEGYYLRIGVKGSGCAGVGERLLLFVVSGERSLLMFVVVATDNNLGFTARESQVLLDSLTEWSQLE